MLEEMTTILCGVFLLHYHKPPTSVEKLFYVLRVFKVYIYYNNSPLSIL